MNYSRVLHNLTVRCICIVQADNARERSLSEKATEPESRSLLE